MKSSMVKNAKGVSGEDLIKELAKPVLNEVEVDRILSSGVDINWRDNKGNGFLHFCALKNLTESMKYLISKGANIHMENNDKQTPLYAAVDGDSIDAVQLLITTGANVDHLDAYKRTPLQDAVISNRSRVVDILTMHTKSVDNKDKYDRNLIFDAVSNGNKSLINKVAQNKNVTINQVDAEGNSVLHHSTVMKDPDLAMKLMEEGADPTIKDKSGKSFLVYAATSGIEYEHVIDKAVSLGYSLNFKNEDNQTILMEVLLAFAKISEIERLRRESLFKMVKKLIFKGVDVSAEDDLKETALFIAVRSRNIETVVLMLDQPQTNPNHKNIRGETPLSIAALEGYDNLDLILVLLKYGADANIPDNDGASTLEKLSEAILYFHNGKVINPYIKQKINENGQYMVLLKEILENSAINVDVLNSHGQPLFFDAVMSKNEYLFKLWLKHGADKNKTNEHGQNIIHYLMLLNGQKAGLTRRSYLEILQNLINIGVDINKKDKEGGTSLHLAAMHKCEHTLKVLLNSRGNTKAQDKKGRTIAHNCVFKNKKEHFKILHFIDQEVLNIPDRFGILPINYAAFMGQKELVLEMIASGAHINNPHPKNPQMVEFLKKTKNNLKVMISSTDDLADKKHLMMLEESMQKDFSF